MDVRPVDKMVNPFLANARFNHEDSDKLLIHIFSFLDDRSLGQIPLVCKSWNLIADDSACLLQTAKRGLIRSIVQRVFLWGCEEEYQKFGRKWESQEAFTKLFQLFSAFLARANIQKGVSEGDGSPIILKVLKSASYALGCLYYQGKGTVKDFKTSVKYYEMSADMGCGDAWEILGRFYSEGLVYKKDELKAFQCFQKAFDYGSTYAYRYLAHCYREGLGVEVNPERAIRYYCLSIEEGQLTSYNELGVLYEDKGHYELAYDYYCKAGRAGSAMAYFNMGLMCLRERGRLGIPTLANEYYLKSASMGYLRAYAALAEMHINGTGAEKDYAKAFEFAQEGVKRGDPYSHNTLGCLYLEGWGVDQNFEKAMEHFLVASGFDLLKPLLNLANMYSQGKGCEKNINLAKNYIREAISIGGGKALDLMKREWVVEIEINGPIDPSLIKISFNDDTINRY